LPARRGRNAYGMNAGGWTISVIAIVIVLVLAWREWGPGR
jgi:hypothetical protein